MGKFKTGCGVLLFVFVIGLPAWAKGSSGNSIQNITEFIRTPAFKNLSAHDQKQYIKDLRAFIVAIENVDIGPVKKSRKLEVWFEYFSQLQEAHAQAQAKESCTLYKDSSGKFCVTCPSYGKMQGDGASTPGTICRGKPDVLHSAMVSKTKDFPTTKIELKTIMDFKESNEGSAVVEINRADIQMPDGRYVNDVNGKTYSIPKNGKIEKPSEAEPGKRIEDIENGKVVDAQANSIGEKTATVVPPVKTATSDIATLKAIRENFTGQLRCIYAGFPISGKSCEGKTEFKLENGKTLSCTAKADAVDPTVAATKPDPKKTILCNPLLFGLDSNDKPFCVKKGKTATNDCDAVASASEGSLGKTIQLNKENPAEAKKISWTLQALCQANEGVIKTLMGTLGSANTQKSYDDIRETCKMFENRFNSYYRQYDTPSEKQKGTR